MGSVTAINEEEALADNVEEFISHCIDTQVKVVGDDGEPRLMPPEFRAMLFAFGLDMYHAGALWSDTTSGREEKSGIILN